MKLFYQVLKLHFYINSPENKIAHFSETEAFDLVCAHSWGRERRERQCDYFSGICKTQIRKV